MIKSLQNFWMGFERPCQVAWSAGRRKGVGQIVQYVVDVLQADRQAHITAVTPVASWSSGVN